jgi:hypothetical protein
MDEIGTDGYGENASMAVSVAVLFWLSSAKSRGMICQGFSI